jgi:Uma2 family endonuclease
VARVRHDPPTDAIVVLQDVGWEEYERMLDVRGEDGKPHISYLDGTVELMSPSVPHETVKSRIGQLVEAWCLERRVEFRAVGEWTLRSRKRRGGLEPDACYVFGTGPWPRRPHLAIEVVWTRRMDKLEIYRRLGVREVWVWRDGSIAVNVLRKGTYRLVPRSLALAGIDLDELGAHLDLPTDSQCIRAYRATLAQRSRLRTSARSGQRQPRPKPAAGSRAHR